MMTATDVLARMIAEAEAKLTPHESYASYSDGNFQVYLVPVSQRTRAMKAHYRVTYYLRNQCGEWKRTSKAQFLEASCAELSKS